MTFLNSTGGATRATASIQNKDRSKDLVFIRLSYTIDASAVDNIIQKDPLYLSCCLKIPQSSFDSKIDAVTLLDTPRDKSPIKQVTSLVIPAVSSNLTSIFASVANQPTTASLASGTSTLTKNITSVQHTPNMSLLLGLTSARTSIVVSYFGSMDFMDDQTSFDVIFGAKPTLLDSNPTRIENNDIRGQVHTYADKCMFDVFLEICKAAYVGAKSSDSETKMVREIL